MPDSHLSDPPANVPAKGLSRHGSALLEANRLLVLSCPDDDELERQARHLMVWLRHQQPALAVEHLDRLDSDEVVERMNRLLAEHSLAEATRTPAPSPGQRLWVLHDPVDAQAHELMLLHRLLQQFPGVRLSALLLTQNPRRFGVGDTAAPRGLLHCALPGRPRPPAPTPTPAPATVVAAPVAPAAAPAPATPPPAPTAAPLRSLDPWLDRLRAWRPDGQRLRAWASRFADLGRALRQHPWLQKVRRSPSIPPQADRPLAAADAPVPAALALARRQPVLPQQAPAPVVRAPSPPSVLSAPLPPEAPAIPQADTHAPAAKPRRKTAAAAKTADEATAEAVKIAKPRAKRASPAKAKKTPSDKDAGPPS